MVEDAFEAVPRDTIVNGFVRALFPEPGRSPSEDSCGDESDEFAGEETGGEAEVGVQEDNIEDGEGEEDGEVPSSSADCSSGDEDFSP